ncbi:MAG: hypothetical protein J6T27_02455, partial [Alphaproteobacteria bacterium]|nr:hypothetical protein [Alphaproteobacteria bacterium]
MNQNEKDFWGSVFFVLLFFNDLTTNNTPIHPNKSVKKATNTKHHFSKMPLSIMDLIKSNIESNDQKAKNHNKNSFHFFIL